MLPNGSAPVAALLPIMNKKLVRTKNKYYFFLVKQHMKNRYWYWSNLRESKSHGIIQKFKCLLGTQKS